MRLAFAPPGSTARGRAGGLGFLLLAILIAAAPTFAQHGRFAADAEIVEQATLVAAGERVEIYAHGIDVDAGFLQLAERAYGRLEALTDRRFDTATIGARIRIYISGAIRFSHVRRAYDHPQDPRGIVFPNARVYRAAMRGTNATYVHEMAHLLTWRYRSHTLREGLADYLALQIHPGADVGPNAGGGDLTAALPSQVLEYVGTTKGPPSWLSRDLPGRRAYYLASYRFVKFLVEKAGMNTFLTLYEADDPTVEYTRLYSTSRDELLRTAGMRQ